MGNEQAPLQSVGQENNGDASNQQATASVVTEADVQAYFKTKFPVVISQEIFDIRYIII